MKYLFILVFLLSSCITPKSLESDEKVFIYVDGHPIELVVDEYDNPYLKQKTACGIVYIPFTFPTEDENVPRIYEIKTQKHGTTK
jgi:hypothetical protein